MDRLFHHAQVIVIDGDSYRNPLAGRRKRITAAAPEAGTEAVA